MVIARPGALKLKPLLGAAALYLDKQLQVDILTFGCCPPDLLVASTCLEIDTLQRASYELLLQSTRA